MRITYKNIYLLMHSNHQRGDNYIFVTCLIGSFHFFVGIHKTIYHSSRLQNISGPFFPPKCSWHYLITKELKSLRLEHLDLTAFGRWKFKSSLQSVFKFSKNSLFACERVKLFKNNEFTSFLTSSESILKLIASRELIAWLCLRSSTMLQVKPWVSIFRTLNVA